MLVCLPVHERLPRNVASLYFRLHNSKMHFSVSLTSFLWPCAYSKSRKYPHFFKMFSKVFPGTFALTPLPITVTFSFRQITAVAQFLVVCFSKVVMPLDWSIVDQKRCVVEDLSWLALMFAFWILLYSRFCSSADVVLL